MKPGQVIHIKSETRDNYWYIESVCYGGTDQESVIHLGRCDGVTKPNCLGKERAMFVPELMIRRLLESGDIKIYDEFAGHDYELTA